MSKNAITTRDSAREYVDAKVGIIFELNKRLMSFFYKFGIRVAFLGVIINF